MKRNYLVKVDGERYETGSKRRFLNHTGTIKFETGLVVYLRVSDEVGINEGEYTNKEEFNKALKAFTET